MSRKKQDIIENTEQPEVTLQDFVIPAKIEAFCEKYKPLNYWREDCDMFTDYQQWFVRLVIRWHCTFRSWLREALR